MRRDCGDKLYRFYKEDRKSTPDMPLEAEDVLKHMVETLLAKGYEGLLLILDEVSLFMKNRTEAATGRGRENAGRAVQPAGQDPLPADLDDLLGAAGARIQAWA